MKKLIKKFLSGGLAKLLDDEKIYKSMSSDEMKLLLSALDKNGFYDGLETGTEEYDRDRNESANANGKWSKFTRAAIANAKKAGYTWYNGTLTKNDKLPTPMQKETPPELETKPKFKFINNPIGTYQPAKISTTKLPQLKEIPTKFIRMDSDEYRQWQEKANNGDPFAKLVIDYQTKHYNADQKTIREEDGYSFFPYSDKEMQKRFDNMYPYSYGDVIQHSDGRIEQYTGGEIPTGARLRQTSANDSATTQVESMYNKWSNASEAKDPRRELLERLADIDLNTPEGRAEWAKLAPEAQKRGVIRTGGNAVNNQFEMRARLDLMNLYAGRGQKYGSYITGIEGDYESPTAKGHGMPTYRVSDEKQRARINGEMANYWINNARKVKWVKKGEVDDDTYNSSPYRITSDGKYLMQNMGYQGNQTLVADDIDGLNLRNGDWWDYVYNTNSGRRIYTADRMVPEGTRPTRNNRYGVGHNGRHMTESTDDLIKNTITENVTPYIDKTKNAAEIYWGKLTSLFDKRGGKLQPKFKI